jgi:hypothetical protein
MLALEGSFGTSTRAGARVMGFYYASPGGDLGPDPIVILTLWIPTLRVPYWGIGASGLAGREAGGAHFVMAEFAYENTGYRS